MKLTVFVMLIVFVNLVYSQEMDYQEIDSNNVKKWTESYSSPYAGVYYFGESESESQLTLLYAKNTLVAQLNWYEWSNEKNEFISFYQTLTNVKIENGQFYSTEYQGIFIYYSVNKIVSKGLRINNPWTVGMEKGVWEIGLKSKQALSYDGKYPKATTGYLYKRDLEKLSANQLKIMRNEIFARYGYIFKQGGQMDTYFKLTDWYRPFHTNIDVYLTCIEKANIKLIQEIEKNL